MDFDRILSETLSAQMSGLNAHQLEGLCAYARFLVAENAKYNLTAVTDPAGIACRHFIDSLLPLSLGGEMFRDGASVIDIGSGAGLPGIPLKLLRPGIRLTALDATEKKVAFMRAAAQVAGVTLTAVAARAEDAAREAGMRDAFDVAVSRGVAALNVLCELCLPFVAVGGVFIAYKGRGAGEELSAAQTAVNRLGGSVGRVEHASLEGAGERTLIYINKIAPTPPAYPRSFARIKKQPL